MGGVRAFRSHRRHGFGRWHWHTYGLRGEGGAAAGVPSGPGWGGEERRRVHEALTGAVWVVGRSVGRRQVCWVGGLRGVMAGVASPTHHGASMASCGADGRIRIQWIGARTLLLAALRMHGWIRAAYMAGSLWVPRSDAHAGAPGHDMNMIHRNVA